jgi:hypothetical protein
MPHAFLMIVCGYCVRKFQPAVPRCLPREGVAFGSEVLEHTAVTALGAEGHLGCPDGDRETCSWRNRHARDLKRKDRRPPPRRGLVRWPARPLLDHLFDLHRGIGPTPSVDAIGSTNARRLEYARYGRQTTGAFRRNVRLLKIRSFGSMA